MSGTSGPSSVSTKQLRIAELARRAPEMCITSLSHHIDIEWMKEAFRLTRKDGASGIDGLTAEEYEKNLEANLRTLIDRMKSGAYRAPPVKRAHIPKGNGELRPIGIPTFEDKVAQRAAAMALEPVYEQDFRNCSYGFRPGRSAHDALESFWKQMMAMGGGWVVEVDIRKFFDTLDHSHIQRIVRQRVNDGVLTKLIGKWLNAGVMADGDVSYPGAGTPQGGVISPLLANVYLHEVLDVWFEDEVLPRLRGRAFLVRYADDFVIGFSNEEDAGRVMEVLPKRFEKYGLTLHPEKTRLLKFQPPPKSGGSDTFDFLGFTHLWAATRNGGWAIKRRTARNRFARALLRIAEWCRAQMHTAMKQQHRTLSLKLKGHYGYYGIAGNSRALNNFELRVTRIWHKWLSRRSQRGISWEDFSAWLKRNPLPPPRLTRPAHRLRAKPAT